MDMLLTGRASEKFSSSRHALGLYRGIANSCQYVVRSEELRAVSLRTVLGVALARTILRLDSLRLGIIKEDTNEPCFVRIPFVGMDDMLEWATVGQGGGDVDFDRELLTKMEKQLDRTWAEMHIRPPWKLIVVENARQSEDETGLTVLEMVFASHHAIADGKSTSVFHEVLLQELNRGLDPPEELRGHVLTFHDNPSPTPPQEELLRPKVSWSFFFKCLWDEFGPAWLKGPPPVTPWTGRPIALTPHELNLRMITIPSEAVPSVLAACRLHSTTLTALLHVLVLCSLSLRVAPDSSPTFRAKTPISLQPYAKAQDGTRLDLSGRMTNMSTAMDHNFDPQTIAAIRSRVPGGGHGQDGLSDSAVWQIAKSVKDEIKEKVAALPNDDVTALLAWVGDWRQRWLGKIGKPRDESWALSNIGSVRYGEYGGGESGTGGWRVRRSIFAQPSMVVGSAFGINVSGVAGGVVTATLNWQQGIVDAELMGGVAEDLSTWLGRFCCAGRFGIFKE